jgi:hypothetical protein
MQLLSFQTDIVQGRSSGSSRQTAFERRQREGNVQAFFNDIAIMLEDDVIEPLINLVLLIAFSNWNKPNFANKETMITDTNALSALNGMGFADRLMMIVNGKIKSRGMSGRIRRAAMFDKLALLIEIGAQFPPILQKVSPDKIIEVFFQSIGEDHKDWQLEDQDIQEAGGGLPEEKTDLTSEVSQELLSQVGGEDNAE